MSETLRTSEVRVEEDYERLLHLFVVRAAYREAARKKMAAEREATCLPPEGFLYQITALADGALIRIHDGHKPNPWYEELKAGSIVYAPRIDADVRDGYATVTRASWLNGPLGEVFSLSQREPVVIHNDQFELGLIAIQEYSDRRLAGDRSLFRQTSPPS